MTDVKKPDWVDDIMLDLITGHNFDYAAKAIREKVSEACDKRAVDELEAMHRFRGKDLPKRDYDNESDELIGQRIDEIVGAE